jgi:AhpD family alkylhydroperoxidase
MQQQEHPFVDHTLESAPPESRPVIAATASKFGFVPSAVARMAASPSVLAGFGRLSAVFESSSLDAREREVLAMTAGHVFGCELCIALHSALSAQVFAERNITDALIVGQPIPDPKLEALRVFVRALIGSHGAASSEELASFLAAGYTPRHALDCVLGVSLYTLTTFSNRLTRAPVDPQFSPA